MTNPEVVPLEDKHTGNNCNNSSGVITNGNCSISHKSAFRIVEAKNSLDSVVASCSSSGFEALATEAGDSASSSRAGKFPILSLSIPTGSVNGNGNASETEGGGSVHTGSFGGLGPKSNFSLHNSLHNQLILDPYANLDVLMSPVGLTFMNPALFPPDNVYKSINSSEPLLCLDDPFSPAAFNPYLASVVCNNENTSEIYSCNGEISNQSSAGYLFFCPSDNNQNSSISTSTTFNELNNYKCSAWNQPGSTEAVFLSTKNAQPVVKPKISKLLNPVETLLNEDLNSKEGSPVPIPQGTPIEGRTKGAINRSVSPYLDPESLVKNTLISQCISLKETSRSAKVADINPVTALYSQATDEAKQSPVIDSPGQQILKKGPGNQLPSNVLSPEHIEAPIKNAPVLPPPVKSSSTRNNNAKRVCSHCEITETTVWRKSPSNSAEFWCNPCKTYYNYHGKTRPQSVIQESVTNRKRRRI